MRYRFYLKDNEEVFITFVADSRMDAEELLKQYHEFNYRDNVGCIEIPSEDEPLLSPYYHNDGDSVQ